VDEYEDDPTGHKVVEGNLSLVQVRIDDIRDYEDALNPIYKEVPIRRKRGRPRIDLPSDEELGKLIR